LKEDVRLPIRGPRNYVSGFHRFRDVITCLAYTPLFLEKMTVNSRSFWL